MTSAGADRHVAGNPRRFELAPDLERGVDVDAPELVAHHLESLGVSLDLEIADAQFVRAEAAANVERMPVDVLDVERLDGDAVGAPA